jgi:predicted MFS family arabinose efflux permease
MGSITAYGALLVVFAQAHQFVVAVAVITLAGVAFLAVVSTLQTTVQLLVDESLRGRTMAVYVMAFTAAYPIGSLIQGWFADQFGAPATTTVSGLTLAVLAGGLGLSGWADRFDRPTPIEADPELV